jgi:hypothetical protein
MSDTNNSTSHTSLKQYLGFGILDLVCNIFLKGVLEESLVCPSGT